MTTEIPPDAPAGSRWRRKTDPAAQYTVTSEPTYDGYVQLTPNWRHGRRTTWVSIASLLRRYERITP